MLRSTPGVVLPPPPIMFGPFWFFKFCFFLERERTKVKLGGQGGRECLEGVEGEEEYEHNIL